MSLEAPKKVVRYNSTFEHGVDDKRRLQIPSKWRTDEEGFEFTIIVWPKHQAGPCLRVLPPHQLEKLVVEIENMKNSDPQKDVLGRIVGGGSEQVTLDKTGRICLPEKLAAAAGIKKNVVLVGMFERFEIWDEERYKHVHAADDVHRPAAFENI